MPKAFARLCVLLCLIFAAFPALAQTAAAPRIGVMTMRPGEIFWERFGHDSIVVVDPVTGQQLSYNFGFFDPTAPDFVSRFARGEMRYQLAVLPTEQDLAMYRQEGRGVSMQWLNLTDAQARQFASDLAENAKPENAFYHYQYFTDNCATRVRDALDRALGGELRRQLSTRSNGATYRSEAVRLADNALWMRVLFDIGLGPRADRPLNIWDASFVPGTLARGIADLKINGAPLVASVEPVLEHQLRPDALDWDTPWWQWFLAGLAIAAGIVLLSRHAPRTFKVLTFAFWIVGGVLGSVLTYLWFFTVHEFAWANQNLWLLNPLALLAAALLLLRKPKTLWLIALLVSVILPLIGMFGYWISVGAQVNAHWIALLLPVHLAVFAGIRALQLRHGQNRINLA